MKRAAALNRVRTSVLMTLMRTAADVWYHMGKSLLCIFSVLRVSVCLRVRFPLNPIPDLIPSFAGSGTAPQSFADCLDLLTAVIASHSRVVLSRGWPGHLAPRTLD